MAVPYSIPSIPKRRNEEEFDMMGRRGRWWKQIRKHYELYIMLLLPVAYIAVEDPALHDRMV